MGVWDKTTPAGTANISEGDDRIRELKDALEEALSSHGTFPGASPGSAPIYVPLAIVSGTKMLFYQASVPTGWTVDDTVDGYIFAGVTEGSTNGGSVAAASALGSESSHTHAAGTLKFVVAEGTTGDISFKDGSGNVDWKIGLSNQTTVAGSNNTAIVESFANDDLETIGTGSGASAAGSSHTHSHTTAMHAQARTICGTKD